MDDNILILGGAVILLYLLSGKQTALGGVNIAALPGLAPGMAGGCVQPGCASAGASGSPGVASPGVASPVAPSQAPAVALGVAPQVFAPPHGVLMTSGPTKEEIMASNAAGYPYVDPATARQAYQTGPSYNPYRYMGEIL